MFTVAPTVVCLQWLLLTVFTVTTHSSVTTQFNIREEPYRTEPDIRTTDIGLKGWNPMLYSLS